MTNEELKALFKETGTRQRDFVEWANNKGVEVRQADVSRHCTKGGISRWAELAYRWFFSHYLPNP